MTAASTVPMELIRENTSDKSRTLTIYQECPGCGLYNKQEEFLLPGQQYELSEGIKRKECPGCKSKKWIVIMTGKDTVFYPNKPK